jgi:PAS domain S-box-containing protein
MLLDDLEIHREELRQRANELSEAHSTLEAMEALFEEAPLGYVTLDTSGTIRECNPTAAKMLGLHRTSLTGWAMSAFAIPGHKRRLIDHLLRARKSGGAPVKTDLALQSRTGALVACQLVTRITPSADGLPKYRTAILDLTDRRRIEAALQTTERRLAAAVEASGAGIFELEIPFQGVLYLSQPLAQMLGYTRFELAEPSALPEWFHDRLHPDDASMLRGAYREFEAHNRGSFQGDVRFRHKDGYWRWIRVWAKATPTSDSGISLVGVVMDVTSEKERNLETERRARQLRALAAELYHVEERERRELATELHDNLAQLIVATKMKLGVVGSLRDQSAVRQQLEGTLELLDRANEMVRSLTLNLSPPILDELGLGPALNWLAKDIESQFGLQVQVEERGDIDISDPRVRFMLFRSIRELLVNTAKHANTKKAWVMLEAEPGGVRVLVEDHGEGFDMNQVRSGGSHGFGLFSIQERVQSSGGEMQVRSAPGEGTTIVVRMSTAEESDLQPPHSGQGLVDAPPAADEAPQRVRVLLADDHELVRNSLARLLDAQSDLEVIGEANSGERAIELTKLLEPDVVIMDVTMSGVGGIEATRRIFAEHPHSRVVGLSMHESDQVARAMKDAGAYDYLSKSCPANLLLDAIRKAAADARTAGM